MYDPAISHLTMEPREMKSRIDTPVCECSWQLDLCVCSVACSCPTLCAPWTVVHRVPLAWISRQEYWSGLPFPPPGHPPDPGIYLSTQEE